MLLMAIGIIVVLGLVYWLMEVIDKRKAKND